MRYITRDAGAAAFGTKIGMEGVLHVTQKGTHIADTIFQLFVGNGIGGVEDAWAVGAVFRARTLDGELSGGGTLVVFGDVARMPFTSFEAALAFCSALGRDIYDRNVAETYMDDLIQRRGMQAVQWVDQVHVIETDPEDEVDESDGGNCDVRVEVPTGRVLH